VVDHHRQACPPNELVIRLQPKESIYMKTNVKAPGLRNAPVQAELDLSYHLRYPDVRRPTSPAHAFHQPCISVGC
jgi:glucose-6-phosphate 1-dehydrogenase